jgi:2-polyprenyl-3-methyl-5-hydroxy-6-metoxy-1,4-benzoquinol methylase
MYASQIEKVIAKEERILVSEYNERTCDVIADLAAGFDLRVAGGINRKGNQYPKPAGSNIPLFHSYDEWYQSLSCGERANPAPKLILFFDGDSVFDEVEALLASRIRFPQVLIVGSSIPMAVLKRVLKRLRTAELVPVIVPTYLLGYDAVYSLQDAEKLVWHYQGLDPDLDEALSEFGITRGSFLDLGTGAGNQAVELARRGFAVTATDITRKAFAKNARTCLNVEFVEDDILRTRLVKPFDYILDRGCFHSLRLSEARIYTARVRKLLKKDGLLFLKSICEDTAGPKIPNSASLAVLADIFQKDFQIVKTKHTVYQGSNIKIQPKAFFFIMKKNTDD